MHMMRLLDNTGDVTISWTADDDERIAAMIQKKMDQGVRFFIIKPFDEQQEPLQITHVSQITGREVNVVDTDIALLFNEGRVGIVGRIRQGIQIVGRAFTAQEAARSQTLAMRQPVGG